MKPYVLIAVLLVVALMPFMPYGYYTVMRWVVCAAFAYLAVQAHETGRAQWVWVWSVAAGVYNPIFKVAASREVWTLLNLITIAVVVYSAWSASSRKLR